jgi:hypothetical protein
MGLNKGAPKLCGRVQTNRARRLGCAKPVTCAKIRMRKEGRCVRSTHKYKEKHFVPNTLSCQNSRCETIDSRVFEVPNILGPSNSRCVTIDFRVENVHIQVYLLKEQACWRNSSMAVMTSRRTRSTSAITASSSLSTPGITCLLRALNSARSTFT